MIIKLSKFMTVKGQVKHIQAPIELKNFAFNGKEYSVIKRTPVNLTISHIGERKVKVNGSAEVSLLIPCNRCLEDVTIPFEIDFHKEFDFKISDNDRIKELDETSYLDGYNLDLDLLIYNEMLIDFPMKVLCDENCKGICSICGINLNKDSCNCIADDADPRMARIQDVFNNFKEV